VRRCRRSRGTSARRACRHTATVKERGAGQPWHRASRASRRSRYLTSHPRRCSHRRISHATVRPARANDTSTVSAPLGRELTNGLYPNQSKVCPVPGLKADFVHAPCHFAEVPKPEVATIPLSAKSSGRKTKIGSPTQLHACLFGRNVSVGLRDVIDARVAVVDSQQSGIGRRIDVNGRII
jgi:hypothetical protein